MSSAMHNQLGGDRMMVMVSARRIVDVWMMPQQCMTLFWRVMTDVGGCYYCFLEGGENGHMMIEESPLWRERRRKSL